MKEALKLALEALETCCAGDYSTGHVIDPSFDEDAVNEAITAIKEALTPTSTQCEVQYEQSSSQEPVAWCQLSLGGRSIAYFDGKPIIMTGKVGNDCHTTPLYTAPPKRPWVELTGLEQKKLMAMSAREAVFATEAKLKELNT